jgi:acyl carrier protein
MTSKKIKGAVLEIIASMFPDEDMSKIKPEESLRDQMGIDSMDFLDIVMELRKKYHIEVPKEDYMQLSTLNSCATYLEPYADRFK